MVGPLDRIYMSEAKDTAANVAQETPENYDIAQQFYATRFVWTGLYTI